MKQIHTTLLFLLAIAGHAQNCTYNEQLAPPGNLCDWKSGALCSDGGVVSFLEMQDGAMHLSRWSPDAQVLWNKRIQHQDPEMWLLPQDVRVRADDGILACGQIHPVNFEQMFAEQLTSDGVREWARFYMLDSAEHGYGGKVLQMVPLDGGGYVFTAWNDHGLSVSHVDDDGIPTWTKRYQPSALGTFGYGVATLIDPSGEYLHVGYAGTTLFLVHTDQQGAPQWSHLYETPFSAIASATRMSNGDYVILGSENSMYYMTAVRLDPQGNILWMRTYDNMGTPDGVLELSNGHLMISARMGEPYSLVEADATGDVLAAWDPPGDPYMAEAHIIQRAQVTGDSVMIGYTTDATSYGEALLIATGTASMDCFLQPASATSTPLAGPWPDSDSLIVTDDVLKTWTMNMGVAQPSNVLDLQSSFGAGPAVPGFVTGLYGTILNSSEATSAPVTATMSFDPALSFVNAEPPPSSVVGQTITWALPAMSGYEQRQLSVQLQVPADVGLLGSVVNHQLAVAQDSVEWTLVNNSATTSQTIVGSYDPNDKLVQPAGFYDIDTDTLLTYTIRFQNTGTAAAVDVVVVDTLPLDVDVTTLRMGTASHPYTYSLTGNGILTVRFSDIQLPDSNVSEPASHGLFTFTIRPILPLTIGQEITNHADIYFDFNPAIRTPDATVVVNSATSVRPVAMLLRLAVFPVPAHNALTVILPGNTEPARLWITGADGRRIAQPVPVLTGGQMQVPVQHLRPGNYVLSVMDRSGRRLSARFTKE